MFMDNYAKKYGIEIVDDPNSLPTFLFYGQDGKIAEEVFFGAMTEPQIHELLRAHGFLPQLN